MKYVKLVAGTFALAIVFAVLPIYMSYSDSANSYAVRTTVPTTTRLPTFENEPSLIYETSILINKSQPFFGNLTITYYPNTPGAQGVAFGFNFYIMTASQFQQYVSAKGQIPAVVYAASSSPSQGCCSPYTIHQNYSVVGQKDGSTKYIIPFDIASSNYTDLYYFLASYNVNAQFPTTIGVTALSTIHHTENFTFAAASAVGVILFSSIGGFLLSRRSDKNQ